MKIDRMKKAILYLVLISFIGPILYATFYVVPFADDFSKVVTYKTYDCGLLEYLFLNVIDFYKTWQGTYFSAFVGGILTYYWGGLSALRFVMFFTSALFFVSFYGCIQGVLEFYKVSKEKRRFMEVLYVLVALFFLLNQTKTEEIFYWHTGMSGYTLPLSCALISITCYFKYEIKQKKVWVILGSIMAIFAAGGALDISAFTCSVLLFAIVYNFVVRKSIERNIWIGICAFIGSFINAIAPGNFVRHELVDSEIRLVGALFATAVRVSDTIADSLRNGLLLLLIVVVFLVAYHNLKTSEFEFKYPGVVFIYCLFGIYITDFPVLLGYSFRLLPDRCVFVEQLAVVLWFVIAFIYLAGWSAKKKMFEFRKEWYIIIVLICMIHLSNYLSITNLMEFTPYKITTNIMNGNFARVSNRQMDVISQIENSSEKDVVVYEYLSDETEWTTISRVGITEDAEHWINLAVADYYDKNSVVVQYITD
ncbi:MAG: hypothetical protein E7299_04360 [Lachnospiraceae bacterium]|nr:hypothetical protein [Lachnospiraceae bacterium]